MFSKEHLTNPESSKSVNNECLFKKKTDEVEEEINATSDAEISAAHAVDIAEKAANAAATFYRILINYFYRYNKANKIVNIPFEIILNTYPNSNVCRAWVENRCNNGINCPYGFHITCPKFKNGSCECGGYQALRCPFGAHVNSDGNNKYYKPNSIDKYLLLFKNKR